MQLVVAAEHCLSASARARASVRWSSDTYCVVLSWVTANAPHAKAFWTAKNPAKSAAASAKLIRRNEKGGGKTRFLI